MHFPRDCCVGSVLTKTPGAFLGSFAARRAKIRDGFCPILIHIFVYLQLLATSLWLALRASLRLFKIVPDDFVSARCSDAHGCANAAKTWMSKSGLALTKKLLFLEVPFIFMFVCYSVQAHHVLGRPSYSLSEDSNTPPSMQVETQIGEYYVTYMAFPAFPSPNEPGRVNLYASRIDNGAPFQGKVTFKVRDDVWFSDKEELLGVQDVDDNVFRQGFEFNKAGNYIIRAEFESDGVPYQIDFPLRIGEPSSFGPLGIAITIILFVLFGVNIVQRKKLVQAKIRSAHESSSRDEVHQSNTP